MQPRSVQSCHSARSEESLIATDCWYLKGIPRCARNDKSKIVQGVSNREERRNHA